MDIMKIGVSVSKFLIISLTLLTLLGEGLFERKLDSIQILLFVSNILLITSMIFTSFKNHTTVYIIFSIIGISLALLMYINNLIVLFGVEVLLVLYIFLFLVSVYFTFNKNQ